MKRQLKLLKISTGFVKHLAKRGCNNHYIVAEFFDSNAGNHVISKLKSQEYCNVPLNPRWIRLSEWGYFYHIISKPSSHNNLESLATSTLIQKIKRECPTSHHTQLDELLCSTDDAFQIISTYEGWFGQQSFSPFGAIENSNF